MKRLLLGSSAVAIVAVAPPLREALAALEPALAPGLFALALLMSLAERAVGRPSSGSAGSRRTGSSRALRVLGRWGWVAAILLCLAPLYAHWSFWPPSRIAAFASMFAELPWADAQGHYEGARRLLGDGVFGAFSERRPINACWLALNLTLAGGRLDVALGLQALVVGLALWLASRAVALRYGLWPSVAFFAANLALVRDYLPTVSTEPLGVAVSSLALGLLTLRGASTDPKLFGVALLAISVALAARPGPQFVLPALLLYGLFFFFERARWRTAVGLILVALVGGAHAGALNTLYGAGEGSLTAYPAYTLYGLTRASDYTAVKEELLAELPASATEGQIAEVAYARAFAKLRSEPGTFLRGLSSNFRKALGKVPMNVSRALSPRWLVVPRAERILPSREETRADRYAALPLLLVAGVGWLAALRRAPFAERAFWATFGVGLLASVPFVFGDAGFRGLAVAYPAIALLLAVGVASRRLPATQAMRRRERQLALESGTLVSLLVGVTLMAPALIRGERTPPRTGAGASTARAVVENAPAVIVAHRPVELSHVPTIRRHAMLTWIRWSSDDRFRVLDDVRLPFAIFAIYDTESQRVRSVVGSPGVLRAAGLVELELEPLDPDGRLERIVSWRRVAAE